MVWVISVQRIHRKMERNSWGTLGKSWSSTVAYSGFSYWNLGGFGSRVHGLHFGDGGDDRCRRKKGRNWYWMELGQDPGQVA